MKKKIIGIFVCLLVILTLVIPVASITDKNEIRMISYDTDVPIWEKGDEWTYHITQSRTFVYNYTFSGDLTLKVVDESDDSYVLEGKTRAKGAFDLGGFGLKTTRLTSISLRLQMRKDDLGLERFLEKIKGICLFKIGPITLPIPVQVDLNMDVRFDPTWVIIPFPLYDGKYGNLSGTEILHNVFINMFWGLVPVYGPQNYSIPLTMVPYICSEEQITVQGEIYDVCNVSAEWIDGSQFISYYSEEVGNIVKGVILIPFGGGTVLYTLNMELKEWSYTP